MTYRRTALPFDRTLSPGTHHTTWEAGDTAEGLYLVRARSGAHGETHRLTVAR